MKKISTLLLLVSLILPLLVSCAGQIAPEGFLRLSENGKSAYHVVIAEEASEDIQKIAEEFISYFKKITGATLKIARDSSKPKSREIVIGKTTRAIDQEVSYEELDEEELVVLACGESLLLTGKTDRACAYAMYDFLEAQCGVRYWSADYETVPKQETLDIANTLSHREKPVFWYRSMNEIGARDEKWMVKMRLNSRQSLGSERFRSNPYVGGGHGYADWFVHTIGKLAEMEKDPKTNSFTNLQPCLTDETVYQTVLKNVRAWLEEYPDANLISISQNDGTDESAMCSCEGCSKLYQDYGRTQSGKWIWFVSKIANELADEYPDVYFDTLAYNFTINAPKNLEIPDNVIVRLAPAHACINHDYQSCQEIGNVNDPKMYSLNFSNAMKNWAEIAEHRFIWDYDALFYNYLAPFCNFDYIYGNMRNYAEANVEGVFFQGDSTGSNSFSELRAYLVAKCLWNPYMPKADFDAMITEFFEGYYGAGTSKPLSQFVNFIHEKVGEKHFTLYGMMVTDWFMPFATTVDEEGVRRLDYSDMIDPMNEFFDKAEALVTDETQKHHLRKARIQVKYYEATASYWINVKYPNDKIEVDEARRRKINEELYADVIACGIQQLSEGQVITSTPNLNNAPLYWDR